MKKLLIYCCYAGCYAFLSCAVKAPLTLVNTSSSNTTAINVPQLLSTYQQPTKKHPYTEIKTIDTEITASNFKDPYYVENVHPDERLFNKAEKREYAKKHEEYYPNGEIKQISYQYKKGRSYGMFYYCSKEYYPNGQLKRDKYENPFTPNHEGYENTFYENGQLESTVYRTGRIYAGNWYRFYDNGQLESYGYYIGPLERFQQRDHWKYYYKNGQLKETGAYQWNASKEDRYAKSTKTGEWKYYNEYGELIKTENY